jgi:putative ABC transport system permease protein
MKYELRLPFYLTWQYLRRGRRWAMLLTVFLLSAAFVNLIFVSSLFNGIIDGSNKQIINTTTGNVYVTTKDGQDFITDTKNILSNIKNIDGVEEVSSQTQVPARLKYKSISGNWQVLAINPEATKKVINVSDKIYEGSYLDKNDTDQIIIGRQIAGGKDVELNSTSLKGAKVGDKITLTGDKGSKEFTIKGIFYTKYINADARAFITEKALGQISSIKGDKSTTIIIKTAKGAKDKKIIEEVNKLNIYGDVFSWEESSGMMKSVSESFLSINVLMSFVGVLIAGITVFIVIYVDILNKRRQIGILRAIGIRPYIIVLSYVILSSVYAVAGVLLGTLIFTLALQPYFNAHPFELPLTDAVLVLNSADYVARAETLIWVSILSGLIPSIIVARSKMLDSIIGK